MHNFRIGFFKFRQNKALGGRGLGLTCVLTGLALGFLRFIFPTCVAASAVLQALLSGRCCNWASEGRGVSEAFSGVCKVLVVVVGEVAVVSEVDALIGDVGSGSLTGNV